MSTPRIVMDGLDQLITDLRNLPAHLTGEAAQRGAAKADEARTTMRSEYREKTGNLRRGVVVRRFDLGRYGIGIEITSSAKHASLYEYGTQTRRNRRGNRGSMPANPVVGRTMSRKRREWYGEVAELMRAEGLTKVTINVR